MGYYDYSVANAYDPNAAATLIPTVENLTGITNSKDPNLYGTAWYDSLDPINTSSTSGTSSFLDTVKGWLGNAYEGFNTPIGTGKNATTLGELGLTTGLGIWSLLNQQSNWQDQLALAKEQLEYNKGLSQANFTTQGTNFLNQSLFQLEGLNAFNSDAGAERASNLTSAVNQLNEAGTKIGLTNAFGDQANSIAKYNTLAS